ncbi:MAG: UDP-N-acetylglucosamine--N-acetylmuramyl-(pentapeptide) pyrophosphoryl-undecaprenol N-acetylglucosamine transferase [Phycisphaeraceae bacterium]|nr:UDP-N-acetylglucosamine--N-acetylmuramyl-(pentapeptide) pyrophosphoryl-undecaprenol N-acetylglucosamine transferase [Phycisphaeraceae bacterium]
MASQAPTVLLIGGGSGGHIFPNLAVWERLRERGWTGDGRFIVSSRAIDKNILQPRGMDYTAMAARTVGRMPWQWCRFLLAWRASGRQIREIVRSCDVVAAVATGGFVSAPSVVAARKAGVPVAVVNLDSIPGRANRMLVRHASALFSVYAHPSMAGATRVGMPMRRAAVGPEDARQARLALGLDADRFTLLITGASQGASSINQMAWHMTRMQSARNMLAQWQVLHLAGRQDAEVLSGAYQKAGIPARVEPFMEEMGLAWRAASVAISRAGAGSVAEVWANATPTIFLPYPHHKDQHQRWNAEPLVQAGAALMFRDCIDPEANTHQIMGPLVDLMEDVDRRHRMSQWLTQTRPADGADVLARWVEQARG